MTDLTREELEAYLAPYRPPPRPPLTLEEVDAFDLATVLPLLPTPDADILQVIIELERQGHHPDIAPEDPSLTLRRIRAVKRACIFMLEEGLEPSFDRMLAICHILRTMEAQQASAAE